MCELRAFLLNIRIAHYLVKLLLPRAGHSGRVHLLVLADVADRSLVLLLNELTIGPRISLIVHHLMLHESAL